MPDVLTAVDFKALTGWPGSDLANALAAFRRSAQEIVSSASGFRRAARFGGIRDDWHAACVAALEASEPQIFFEQHFRAFRVYDENRSDGLFTGYYEPVVKGSLTQDTNHPVPIYAKPMDLVAFSAAEKADTGLGYGRRIQEKALPYDTRKEIENGSIAGKAEVICWLSDWVDAFFMHVQGQGRVILEDGSKLRLSYAGKSGHAYSSLGQLLVEKAAVPREKMSMQVIRQWLSDHPHEARALMWQNESYIFFQRTEVADAELGGIGAARVNLTPMHTLAIDRANWMFGTPMWIETNHPPESPTPLASFTRLMIAQDTGSAIKGLVRGDVFWGWGEDAALIAGHMKSTGAMTALLPLPLARQLGHTA